MWHDNDYIHKTYLILFLIHFLGLQNMLNQAEFIQHTMAQKENLR